MTLAAPLLAFSSRIGRFEFPLESSPALAEATRNFHANLAALEAVWPRTVLCVPETPPEVEWLYARDGALSGRYIDGQWIGHVSIPAKSAAKMLGKASVTGSSAVLLAPTHAQQIRTMLDRINAQQVLIVVIPGEHVAGTTLCCLDFSADIRARRLWLAAGPDWTAELTALLEAQDGIAPASTIIRVPGLNTPTVDRVFKPCETILTKNSQTHRSFLGLLHNKVRTPSRPAKKICVVTGRFQLWDDAPAVLAKSLAGTTLEVVTLDASIAGQTSALRVARTADGCDAMVTANLSRADLPLVLPNNVPWITWLSTNRMVKFDPSATGDRLVVADPAVRARALEAGWPEANVLIGQEPVRAGAQSRNAQPAILANLAPLVMPRSVEEMSSQRLVWERVEHEIAQNPFCIGASPIEYLCGVAEQIGIARGTLPIDLFRSELLEPAFMRALALQLMKQKTNFRIFGYGWGALPEFASVYSGPIDGEAALSSALSLTSVLIDVWPGALAHPARRAGRPVVKPWGRDAASFQRELSRASLTTSKPTIAEPFNLQRVLDTL